MDDPKTSCSRLDNEMEISPSFRVNELENEFDSKATRKKINAIYIISYNYAGFMKGKKFSYS